MTAKEPSDQPAKESPEPLEQDSAEQASAEQASSSPDSARQESAAPIEVPETDAGEKADVPSPAAATTKATSLAGYAWLLRVGINAVVFVAVGISLIALLGLAQRVGWIASGNVASSESDEDADQGDAVYSCPMHPQIRMDRPGKCPICKMKLVLVSGGKASAGTSPDDRYICPMICTPASTEKGRCPVCAMELVPAIGGSGDGAATIIDPVRAGLSVFGRRLPSRKSCFKPSARSARSITTKASSPRSPPTLMAGWRRCTPTTLVCR